MKKMPSDEVAAIKRYWDTMIEALHSDIGQITEGHSVIRREFQDMRKEFRDEFKKMRATAAFIERLRATQ